VPHLDLLTGSLELANADIALATVRGREAALQRMLERITDHYELVIVDGPPGFSLLTIAAIVAADGLVVPVTAEPMAVDALDPFLASTDRVRVRMQVRAPLLGLVLTQVDPRRSVSREASERLRAEYRDQVFHTEIRWTTTLSVAPQGRRPPVPNDACRRLGGEVLHRVAALLHSD